jgi:condensin complex subunit 3
VYEEVSEAVENKKLGLDATGRNALFKIHVSLGKIVNALEKEREVAAGKGERGESVMRESVPRSTRGESMVSSAGSGRSRRESTGLSASAGSGSGRRASEVKVKKTREPVVKEEPVEEEVEDEGETTQVLKREEEEDDDDSGTIVGEGEEHDRTATTVTGEPQQQEQEQDSLVESLLDDDGDIEMGGF